MRKKKTAFAKMTCSVRSQVGAGIQVFGLPKPIIFLFYLANQELVIIYVKK